METNHYKLELERAVARVKTWRDGLTADGALTSGVSLEVGTNEGWVCPEADNWLAEVRERCAPVLTAFDQAVQDVTDDWNEQPKEVEDGNWRGLAYITYPRGGQVPIG